MAQHIADPMRDGTADLAACRKLLRNGSRSFHAASFLLPRAIADRATALYAFCRIADDAVDQGTGDHGVIDALRTRITMIYAGIPFDHPADRALANVISTCSLPREALDALIEGFAWDVALRRYNTLAELEEYAARVAGCVGILMTAAMDVRDRDTLARAADLGVAMQLSNIARDIGEDACNGRLYLPLDWLAEFHIDADAFLAQPHFSDAFAILAERLVQRADFLYTRALTGVEDLPARCRIGIRAAALLYREIGRTVMRQGGNAIASRAVVPSQTKVRLLLQAVLPIRANAPLKIQPPLPATAFLVMAAAGPAHLRPENDVVPKPAWWNFPARLVPILSIIEKLERNERDRIAARHVKSIEYS